MTRRRTWQLGAFIAGAALLALLALVLFGRLRFWHSEDSYTVRFERSVTGLSTGARVELWGVPIGTVEAIALDRSSPSAPVVVTIEVARGTRIPADARASLEIEGLTWAKYIDLVGGDFSGPRLPPGSEIAASETGLPAFFDRMARVSIHLDSIAAKVEIALDQVLAVFDDETRERVATILVRLDRGSEALSVAAVDLQEFSGQLRRRGPQVLRAAAQTGDDMKRASAAARDAMTDVRGAARDLRVAAAEVSDTASDSGADLRSLLANLHFAAVGFRRIVRTIEGNPALLLRGRSPPERDYR